MFWAFKAYILQEWHYVVRGISINALSIGHDVNVIELLKCARAGRMYRAHDGSPEMRQPLENIDTLGRGELVQSAGKKDFLLQYFYDTSTPREAD